MNWPWPKGSKWVSFGGSHSSDGNGNVHSSLDFWRPTLCFFWGCDTPWVYSAHSGRVANRPFSRCNVRIVHSSDWQTDYYHMDDLLVSPGQYVEQGQLLGRYANDYETATCNGGSSLGPHLHFSLVNPVGEYESLDGWNISGYRITMSNKNYDRDCSKTYFEKNGRKYCHLEPLSHS